MHSPGVIWEPRPPKMVEEGIRSVPHEHSFLADALISHEHFGRSILQSFLF